MHKTSPVRCVMPGLCADISTDISIAYSPSLYQDDAAISTYITRPNEHLSRWEPKPHELLEFCSAAMISRLARDSESCARHVDRYADEGWSRRGGTGTRWKHVELATSRSFSFSHHLLFFSLSSSLMPRITSRKSFAHLQENVYM